MRYFSRHGRFSVHLQPVERRYPSELQVAHIGNMPEKRHWVRREFSTYNFSFVFRGTGFYEWSGTRYPVHGPMVLRQWPAAPMHYGPKRAWHEVFVVYPPTAADTLARRGYVPRDRPLWSMGDTRGVQHHLDDLSRLLSSPAGLADQIDRIDRCCEQLILESLMGAAAAPMEGSADRVASVRRWIETHWRDDHDFDELARRHGLSPTHSRARPLPWRAERKTRLSASQPQARAISAPWLAPHLAPARLGTVRTQAA